MLFRLWLASPKSPLICRSDAPVAKSPANHPHRPEGSAPTKCQASPLVGAPPPSRKSHPPPPPRQGGGAPTIFLSPPLVGATPPSRKASQPTTHRQGGGAPTKCQAPPCRRDAPGAKSPAKHPPPPQGRAPTKCQAAAPPHGRSGQSALSTRPGLSRLCGSRAFLTARIMAKAIGSL